jgi:hypothetical protein
LFLGNRRLHRTELTCTSLEQSQLPARGQNFSIKMKSKQKHLQNAAAYKGIYLMLQTAGDYNNRGNPSQSNSIDNDKHKSNGGKSYGLKGSEQAAGRKRDRNRNYGRNETNKNDEEENESSDDEHHKKRINRNSHIPVILENRRFACPYSKKDPERFRKTVCCLSFWPSISRLKYVWYIER